MPTDRLDAAGPDGRPTDFPADEVDEAARGRRRASLSRSAREVPVPRHRLGVPETAEDGLWRSGATRTSAPAMAELIAAREIAVATLDGELAGAVRVHAVSAHTGEFGMLAAAPEHRGSGVGRALVDFAERHSREQGMRAMQLELLVPRTWRHPSKVFLDGWYRRIGYEVVRRTRLDENHPELAPLLATECELLVYEKPLG